MKNPLESKYGDNWLIEGNVMHRAYYISGVGQSMFINMTAFLNGSSPSQALNYWASSSEAIIRNNIFRHGAEGILANGTAFLEGTSSGTKRWEAQGLTRAYRNRIDNNLFVDIGSSEWLRETLGSSMRTLRTASQAFTHNTVVDTRYSIYGDAAAANIMGNGANSWYSGLVSPYIRWDSATSRFERNILMNRSGLTATTKRGTNYPNSTYLIQATDPDRSPVTLFENWVERPTAGMKYGVEGIIDRRTFV